MIWVPFWWSRGIGGKSAVDYLMRVRDMTFIEAVSQIANDESALWYSFVEICNKR